MLCDFFVTFYLCSKHSLRLKKLYVRDFIYHTVLIQVGYLVQIYRCNRIYVSCSFLKVKETN
jgi:hypothetical protein